MAYDKIRLSWLVSWLVLGALSTPASALAEYPKIPPICDEGDPRRCTQPMKRGETAPFAGQLLNTDKAIHLGQLASSCGARIDLAVVTEQRLAKAAQTAQEARQSLDLDFAAKETGLWKSEAARLSGEVDTWYRSPLFVAIVSVTLTVAAIRVLAEVYQN